MGENLFGLGRVSSVDRTVKKGLYAPKTKTNNYFVYLNGSEGKKVLAHCFAQIRSPQNYELLVELIESAWNLVASSEEDVHPSYKWMQETFTIVQE